MGNGTLDWIRYSWAFTLNHCERDSVDEDDEVTDDVLPRTANLELVGDDELVVLGVVEVYEANSLALSSRAAVLLNREVMDKVTVNLLIDLDCAGGDDCFDSSDGFLQVVLVYPGVEFLDCDLEPVFQDHVGAALALQIQLRWFNVLVSKTLDLFDGRFF